ncbi:hypothetical protein [Hyphomicrobium sp.]|uniref:hypothetical protein n=1 Tax=Hyphomicrobium sp. TaxID=82 RepID=UPI002E374578|nr:hypothetical protein [Hyphomicrobium sp.]HEX2843124.1 hypothetical protein [Hyphomicrobium sp.]
MRGLKQRVSRSLGLGLAAAAALAVVGLAHADTQQPQPGLVEVKLGLESISKAERTQLWTRVDEYATVDALLEFCGRKLNLQRRTWVAVAPCVEVASLRKVASVFRAKKSEYVKAWETAFADPEKKKSLCESQKPKLAEYTKILDAHIAEATSMCNACIFC